MSKAPRIWRNWKRYEETPCGANSYICYDDNILGPSIPYLSLQEHQAIISDIESRLKIATEALELCSGDTKLSSDLEDESLCRKRILKEALEKIKRKGMDI